MQNSYAELIASLRSLSVVNLLLFNKFDCGLPQAPNDDSTPSSSSLCRGYPAPHYKMYDVQCTMNKRVSPSTHYK
ncbi:MAG: hypothetical protein LUH40_00950 [Clostridiales bacterium]|nr:hypothetical protein [Clostridiales bacterium]